MALLRFRNLSYNHMTGTLPPWADLNAFPQLLTLDLSHNQVTRNSQPVLLCVTRVMAS